MAMVIAEFATTNASLPPDSACAYSALNSCLTIGCRPAFSAQSTRSEAKEKRLMETVLRLNPRGGRGTVHMTSMVTGSQREWQKRQGQKSPCYTTRTEDVPQARI